MLDHEKRMKSQLYLPADYRSHLIAEVQTISDLFQNRVFPVFDNIDIEADQHAEDFFNKTMVAAFNESVDPANIAENAIDAGFVKYSSLSLAKYTLLASAISILYHLWEQQARLFLFREMGHMYKLHIAKFCLKGMDDIKECFALHGVAIEHFGCWSKLDELRLLCNVIKHGDGKSAAQLLRRTPALFQEPYRVKPFPFPIPSTLLDETLDLSEVVFITYGKAVASFWEEVPERCYTH